MTTFHLFSRLPAELRLMVWEATVVPREIRLVYDDSTTTVTHREGVWTSSTPTPPTLLACYEAWEYLSTKFYTQKLLSEEGKYIWINAKDDWPQVSLRHLGQFLDSTHPSLFAMRKLVIEVGLGDAHLLNFRLEVPNRLKQYSDTLRDLTFIHEHNPSTSIKWQTRHMHMFKAWYWTCKPVPWYTRSRNPDSGDTDLTPENWLKWEYDETRRVCAQYRWNATEDFLDIVFGTMFWWPWRHKRCRCAPGDDPGQRLFDAMRKQRASE